MENSQKNDERSLDELYRDLGMVDFLYIEAHEYLEELQTKREQLIAQIRKQHGTNQNLHSGS